MHGLPRPSRSLLRTRARQIVRLGGRSSTLETPSGDKGPSGRCVPAARLSLTSRPAESAASGAALLVREVLQNSLSLEKHQSVIGICGASKASKLRFSRPAHVRCHVRHSPERSFLCLKFLKSFSGSRLHHSLRNGQTEASSGVF